MVLAAAHLSTDAVSLATELRRLEPVLHTCIRQSGIDPQTLRGIAVGFCGVVDGETGEILSTLNKYNDSQEVNLQAWARQAFGLELRLENDACLALLGEHLAGAARGCRDVVMVTLGTGIGGAAMLGGRLLRSHAGQAGCLGGHLPVQLEGRLCACGAIGCAEAEASTAVLPLLCREHPGFPQSHLALAPVLDFKTLFQAVDQQDTVAEQILARCLLVWSVLTVGLIHAYGPQRVVFGGGVLRRGEALLDPIRAHVERHTWRTTRGLPQIVRAQLDENAALLGGEALFATVSGTLGTPSAELTSDV